MFSNIMQYRSLLFPGHMDFISTYENGGHNNQNRNDNSYEIDNSKPLTDDFLVNLIVEMTRQKDTLLTDYGIELSRVAVDVGAAVCFSAMEQCSGSEAALKTLGESTCDVTASDCLCNRFGFDCVLYEGDIDQTGVMRKRHELLEKVDQCPYAVFAREPLSPYKKCSSPAFIPKFSWNSDGATTFENVAKDQRFCGSVNLVEEFATPYSIKRDLELFRNVWVKSRERNNQGKSEMSQNDSSKTTIIPKTSYWPDLLKIDIDNGDCDVLSQVLHGAGIRGGINQHTKNVVLPAFISIEAMSFRFPPFAAYRGKFRKAKWNPETSSAVFAEKFFENYDSDNESIDELTKWNFAGCSTGEILRITEPYGYRVLSVDVDLSIVLVHGKIYEAIKSGESNTPNSKPNSDSSLASSKDKSCIKLRDAPISLHSAWVRDHYLSRVGTPDGNKSRKMIDSTPHERSDDKHVAYDYIHIFPSLLGGVVVKPETILEIKNELESRRKNEYNLTSVSVDHNGNVIRSTGPSSPKLKSLEKDALCQLQSQLLTFGAYFGSLEVKSAGITSLEDNCNLTVTSTWSLQKYKDVSYFDDYTLPEQVCVGKRDEVQKISGSEWESKIEAMKKELGVVNDNFELMKDTESANSASSDGSKANRKTSFEKMILEKRRSSQALKNSNKRVTIKPVADETNPQSIKKGTCAVGFIDQGEFINPENCAKALCKQTSSMKKNKKTCKYVAYNALLNFCMAYSEECGATPLRTDGNRNNYELWEITLEG